MRKYNINRAFRKNCLITIPLSEFTARAGQRLLENQHECLHKLEGITAQTIHIPSEGGMIAAQVIAPKDLQEKNPCMFDIHGGGFVYDASRTHYESAARYAMESGSVVIFPRYRLAPAYPYPAAINDCKAVFAWITGHADEYRIDRERIGVCGDSSGGYLAARLTNWAAANGYQLCYQLLIYPVTDAKMTTDSMKRYVDTPVWNAKLNRTIWNWYYGGKENVEPTLLEDGLPEGLPETYLETAEFDCLHDEGLLYAQRLKEAGVRVVVNETRETMHGFDLTDCEITRQALKKRIEFIRRHIGTVLPRPLS